jgi:hypothetical protein
LKIQAPIAWARRSSAPRTEDGSGQRSRRLAFFLFIFCTRRAESAATVPRTVPYRLCPERCALGQHNPLARLKLRAMATV